MNLEGLHQDGGDDKWLARLDGIISWLASGDVVPEISLRRYESSCHLRDEVSVGNKSCPLVREAWLYLLLVCAARLADPMVATSCLPFPS